VNAIAPEIDLARWRSFALPLIGREAPSAGGAIGLRNAAGYACGLLVFRVERDLKHGTVLAVDLFVALDLMNEEEATRALLLAAEAKAAALGCCALHIRSDISQKALRQRFAAMGHRTGAHLFCKMVASSALPN
jgi:hypothetical protein